MFMLEQVFYYSTDYSVQECVERILQEPQQFSCKWGTALWYRAERISYNQVRIIFTGGQFRKTKRTQYLMELVPAEKQTQITMRFQKELFGLLPMTIPADVDRCVEQILNAVKTGYETNYPAKN
jgi:hypothetical protein